MLFSVHITVIYFVTTYSLENCSLKTHMESSQLITNGNKDFKLCWDFTKILTNQHLFLGSYTDMLINTDEVIHNIMRLNQTLGWVYLFIYFCLLRKTISNPSQKIWLFDSYELP